MKKITLSLIGFVALLASNSVQAQHPCATNDVMDEFRANNPEKAALMDQEMEQIRLLESGQNNAKSNRSTFVIPVVFHVIHTNGIENISNEQIYDAIEVMNEDFNKNNTWNLSNPAFTPIAADVEVEFKLAKRDNSGNCHNGITRTFSNTTNNGDSEDQIDAVVAEHGTWPSTKYMNIFVVNYANGAAGYTTYPQMNFFNSGSMRNGIWSLHNYVGSIGTSNTQRASTLSHEVGHWLNLAHTWGNSNDPGLSTNCGEDDDVADTPLTIGWQTCNINGETCGSLDNVENFMEYSYCSKMFTEGQKTRMHNALGSGQGGRSNVVSAGNLTATGVNDPDVLCSADFRSNINSVCPGETIQFFDDSYHVATGWTWSFPGGSPASSTSQNPSVTYNSPGNYEVTLIVTDGTTSNTKTKNNFITVINSNSLPLIENFEDMTSLENGGWTSAGNSATNFNLSTTVSYPGGSQSAFLNNYSSGSGSYVAELISPIIDLENMDPLIFSFRYAYKNVTTVDSDILEVYFSNNCGSSWSTRKIINLADVAGTQATAFNNPSEEDWVYDYIDGILFTGFAVNNFRFKFRFTGGDGNNLYIDNINLYNSSLNTEDLSKEVGLNIFPNPTKGNTKVQVTLHNENNVKLTVKDYLGRVIYFDDKGVQTQGVNEYTLNSNDWANGMYLIEISINDQLLTKKLIKN